MTDYATRTGRQPDFRIKYRWLRAQGDGRSQTLFQHMRSDFLYDGDDPQTDGTYMIWPEFENRDGAPLAEGTEVLETGTATMWIVSDEHRSYHLSRLFPGTRGFLVVGSRKFAEAEVLEIFQKK